jgi:hypothetical protein
VDHHVSRRGFLARSVGTAALLSAGGLPGCEGQHYLDLGGGTDQLQVLPAREYAILRAVARCVVPGEGAEPGADELGVPARIDRELSFHPPRLGEDITLALRLVEWWPLPSCFARFTKLPAEEQHSQLAGMASSRFALPRAAFQGIRFLIMFFYYTLDESWPAIGYEGPWIVRGPFPSSRGDGR